jgi:hypothetical protein
MVVFGCFSSGEIQDWARDKEDIVVERTVADQDTKM